MGRRIPTVSKHMIARGRQLRGQSSTPERLLWSKLRNGRCDDFKFRRQEPVGPFVADFLCPSLRLIIELDGRSHDEREVQDRERQTFLERLGFLVVRVGNDRVISDLAGVAEGIAVACEERLRELGLRVDDVHRPLTRSERER
jgi:very-short-patch-repair endonuclease